MSRVAKVVAVLGVIAGASGMVLPLTAYAKESAKVDFQANVGQYIGLATDGVNLGADGLNLGTLRLDGAASTAEIQIRVSTGAEDGYTVQIKGSTEGNGADHTSLVHTAVLDGTETVSNDTIIRAGTLTEAYSTWGYSIDNGQTYKAVTDEPEELVHADSADARTTVIKIGVNAKGTQRPGQYKGKLTLSATVNP